MGILEDIAHQLDSLTAETAGLKAEVAALKEKVSPSLETFTLRDLATLPGSPSLKTLRNSPAHQPRHGEPDGYRGREKAWTAKTVTEWRRQLIKPLAVAKRGIA